MHNNIHTDPSAFLQTLLPCCGEVVVCVECLFTWSWRADLCEDEGIPLALGRVPYRRAMHGGKAKNDRIDSHKIAASLRGGLMVDALQRENRPGSCSGGVGTLALHPWVGTILARVMRDEIEEIARSPQVQACVSYDRPVKSARASNNKRPGPRGKQIGHAQLTWAFSGAAVRFLKPDEPAKKYLATFASKHGTGKAQSILAPTRGRAVYCHGPAIRVWCRTTAGPATRVRHSRSGD